MRTIPSIFRSYFPCRPISSMRPATNASCLDPRFSAVYTFAGGADVLRGAVGATTTQPSANLLGQSFSATTLSTAGGGGGLSCSRTNAIGRSPSSVLRPERGVDEEFAYAHRFGGDSQVQLSLYNTNVYGRTSMARSTIRSRLSPRSARALSTPRRSQAQRRRSPLSAGVPTHWRYSASPEASTSVRYARGASR